MPDQPAPPRPMSRLRLWAYRLAAMVLAPLVALVLLEGALRVAGVGTSLDFFLRMPDRAAWQTNHAFSWRFFPRELARTPVIEVVPVAKGPETVRIVVLGGSAAMGTPDEAFGVGRVLGVMLEEAYPDRRFEVVNAAMTAVNSHVVLEIARDCLEVAPDLFIVYMGNNEVVGPYGPGTVLAGYSPWRPLIRAGVRVKMTRTGQAMAALTKALGGAESPAKGWKGMELFLEQTVPADDPRLETVASHLRANVLDILALARGAGVPVVLSTVAVNLRDCPPFASVHSRVLTADQRKAWDEHLAAAREAEEAGRWVEAIQRLRQAVAIDPGHAEVRYRLGRAQLELGHADEAREALALARDMDALRFRADSRLNGVLREVGRAAGQGVRFVDAEKAFADDPRSVAGLPGGELFYEHVHFRFEGTHLLASVLFDAVARALGDRLGPPPGEAPASVSVCRDRLAYTDLRRYENARVMARMMAEPPFPNQFGYAARHAVLEARLDAFRDEHLAAARRQALKAYAAAVGRRPKDVFVRRLYAAALVGTGRLEEGAAAWREAAERVPGHQPTWANLASTLLNLGRPEQAEEAVRTALAIEPLTPDPHKVYGTIHMATGRGEQAIAELREALRLRPDDTEAMLNLGVVLATSGRKEEAARQFERMLGFGPDAGALNNLGKLAAEDGRGEDAIAWYRQALEVDPGQGDAAIALGGLLMKHRDAAGAADAFERAAAADPDEVGPWLGLARARAVLGRETEAATAYRKAVSLGGDDSDLLGEFAFFLATAPDPAVRDATEARVLASEACRLTRFADPRPLDALAAALAAAGDYAQAVEAAERAVVMARQAGHERLAASLAQRLAVYRAGKPFVRPTVGEQ